MIKEKFSAIFIDELPIELKEVCIEYFSNKVDIVDTYCDDVDLTICTSTSFLNNNYTRAFIIYDSTENDNKIKSKYFYNPRSASIEFFKYWLDRNFKSLNIPFLSKNHHQTILLIP